MSTITRKLQQIGSGKSKGSFLLTLPKEWCIEHKLRSGDELELVIDRVGKATILITLPKKNINNKSKVVLNYRDYSEMRALSRAILGRYLDGYEIILIEGIPQAGKRKLETRKMIRDLSRKLYGSWLNEKDRTFELVVSSELISPSTLLHDLFLISKLMFRDALQAFKESNLELAEDIVERDNQADRLYFHIVRTLKILLREPFLIQDETFSLLDTLDYRMIASNLETLADASEEVAQKIISGELDYKKTHEQTISEVVSLFEFLEDQLEASFSCFKNKDEESAVDMVKRGQKVQDRIENLRTFDIDPVILSVLEEAIDCIVDILELVGGR